MLLRFHLLTSFSNLSVQAIEVLLTQRDALESKFEPIETKKQQMNPVVNIYRTLGRRMELITLFVL